MQMTPKQLKEALNRRVQYGEMSMTMCDSACETIDGMMDIIRRTAVIVDPDCPDIDAYVDGHCGLPEAVERLKANTNTEKPASLPGQVKPMVGFMCTACGKQLLESQDWPFDTGDMVSQNGHDESPLMVTGYITAEQRLFVRDPSSRLSNGDEFEMHFCEVTAHWRRVKPNTNISGA